MTGEIPYDELEKRKSGMICTYLEDGDVGLSGVDNTHPFYPVLLVVEGRDGCHFSRPIEKEYQNFYTRF